MKTIIFTTLLLLSHLCLASDLSGRWMRAQAPAGEKPINFILVDHFYRFTGQERFVFENGELSHTIDQSVKIAYKSDDSLEGTVDFFDSRGCSFKNLSVKAQLQNPDTLNVLMTVPRYKIVTISAGSSREERHPVYCWDHYYQRRYVCGHEWRPSKPRSVTHECRLLEYVEVPVQLLRTES